MTKIDFAGRAVLVTGAGRGLGRAYALLLAERGGHVTVCDTGGDADGNDASPGPADEVVAEITSAGGQAVACSVSIATEEGAASAVATAMATFGRLDAVINNAGIFSAASFPGEPLDTYQRFLDVHHLGTLNVCRAAWSHLVASGSGRIVNTVSSSMLGYPEMTHYASAKGAVYALTRALAVEGDAVGIGVNAIAPAAGTRMVDRAAHLLPAGVADLMRASMHPELVAPVAAYLASPDCRLSGEVLSAAGGTVSRLVMVSTPGIACADLTVEQVHEQIDAVLSMTGAVPVPLVLPLAAPSV